MHLAALLPTTSSSAPVMQLLLDHAASCAAAQADATTVNTNSAASIASTVNTANTKSEAHVNIDASGGPAAAPPQPDGAPSSQQPAVAQRQTSSSHLDVTTAASGGLGDASAVQMPAPLSIARTLLPAPLARRGGTAAGPTVALLGEELLRLAAQSNGGTAAAVAGGSGVGWAASGGSFDTAADTSDGAAALLGGGHLLSDTKGTGVAGGTESDVGIGALRHGRGGEVGAGGVRGGAGVAKGVEAEAEQGLLAVMGARDSTGSTWSASEPSSYSTPRQELENRDAGGATDAGADAAQQLTVQGAGQSAGGAGMWVKSMKALVVLVPVLTAVGLAWAGVGGSRGAGCGAEGGLGGGGGLAHEAVWWLPVVLGGLVVSVAGVAASVAIRKVMKMPIAEETEHGGQD